MVKKKYSHYESAKGWLRDTILNIHDLHPDYIFLTESSAIPFGWSIKETWKKAYPNEPLPKFYRIEPGVLLEDKGNYEGTKKYLQKRIKKDNARVIVFDEGQDSNAPTQIYIKNPKYNTNFPFININVKSDNILYKERTLSKTMQNLDLASSKVSSNKIDKLFGVMGSTRYISYPFEGPYGGAQRVTIRSKKLLDWKYLPKYHPGNYRKSQEELDDIEKNLEKRYKKGLFVGGIIRDSKKRKDALEYIQKLKKLGREAGEELHTELEKKKKLEHIVSSVVAVGGILGSFFFLGSSVTGNAIANLNVQNSSFLGAGLLIVGLVAGWFWLKGKK